MRKRPDLVRVIDTESHQSEDLGTIFQSFREIDSAEPETRSTGLGLSISKKIGNMGRQIRVTSTPVPEAHFASAAEIQ